ncbi:MAG: methylmalonyl-CoA mutase family protein, partial [Pyrinomonadaceae bacterium]
FHTNEDVPIPILRVDERIEREQVARLQAVRAKRDAADADAAIRRITDTANSTENLMPHILTAVESHVTVGEISHALRKVWGEYQEAVTI